MTATNSSAPQLFSGGNEMANLILSTGVLQKGWSCVTELQQQRQPFSVKPFRRFTIVAFSSSAAPTMDEAQGWLDPSLELLDKSSSSPLAFLATKDNTRISIHRPSHSAFLHLLLNPALTDQLKELQLKKPGDQKKQTQLILVGRSLGGSVAALFALWLLKKRSESKDALITPICITYGSPFIGDAGLQRAISKVEKLKSHFWHVVGNDDIVARAFVVPRLASQVVPDAPAEFKPFGTYFLCSKVGCTCVDHPDSVLDLLQIRDVDPADLHVQAYDYGAVLQQLKEKIRNKSSAQPRGNSSIQIGLSLQLEALGIMAHQHKDLLIEMECRERVVDIRRKGAQNPSKKFNDAKKQMALLEWYMKRCEEGEMDYYDCFKERNAERDYDVINFKNVLNRYWKETVEEAENNPQTSDVPLRDRFLFSGTTYRRMVEPLDIADYYRKPRNRDYVNKKRAPHYETLERWHEASVKSKKEEPKEKKAKIMTEDSCFWAHVEEAALTVKELKGRREQGDMELDGLRNKLKNFEGYVWKLIGNHALSTTVFFERSTFMKWWKQYESELQHSSEFTSYMKSGDYRCYK
ncbi:senescence-associated carboxylesterase 101-like [Nymphaea colorata]|nr:senescence-associated carboxylesterase 101-like [Nymphaea colorata]